MQFENVAEQHFKPPIVPEHVIGDASDAGENEDDSRKRFDVFENLFQGNLQMQGATTPFAAPL